MQLREFSHKEVVLQTRTTPDQLLSYATNGLIEGFYTEELALREALLYPPFASFILLTWEGSKETVEKVEQEIKKRTSEFSGNFYSNPLSTAAKTLRHALFRLPNKDEKYTSLIEIVKSFPPYIKIEIDPNRIV
jgi:primosomal protein N'